MTLAKRLHEEWRVREQSVALIPVPSFTEEGLVLGAGTVLVPAEANRDLQPLQGQEARPLALLSAAYGAPVSPAVLRGIERSAACWRKGEDALAGIHLALTGLGTPPDPRESARRLFFADGLMKAGATPRTLVEAFAFGTDYANALEKFDASELRLPPGVPGGGRWTRSLGSLAAASAAQVASLARFGRGLIGPAGGRAVAYFQAIFVPSPNNMLGEADIAGLPGGRVVWNRDELSVQITHPGTDGQPRTVSARRNADGVVRDEQGRAVGRALPDGQLAIDAAALPGARVKSDDPRLCPAWDKDKQSAKRGWEYQAKVAAVVNPPPYVPTPYGYGYELLKPDGTPVSFDDCQQATGMMVEAKGPGYAKLLREGFGPPTLAEQWSDQCTRQLEASQGRKTWYFAEREAADYAREVFRTGCNGRETVEIKYWPGDNPK